MILLHHNMLNVLGEAVKFFKNLVYIE